MRSYNDDLVIAASIGCWVRETALTVNKREVQYKKALLSGISVSGKTLNTRIEGQHGYKPPSAISQKALNEMSQFSWIIKG